MLLAAGISRCAAVADSSLMRPTDAKVLMRRHEELAAASNLTSASSSAASAIVVQPTGQVETVSGLQSFEKEFEKFKKKFGRTYTQGSEDHHMRQDLFKERLAAVRKHNAEAKRDPSIGWRASTNAFSDWTEAELSTLHGYKRLHLGNRPVASLFAEKGASLQAVSEKEGVPQMPMMGGGMMMGMCVGSEQSCAAPARCCKPLVCSARGLCEWPPEETPVHLDWGKDLKGGTFVRDQGMCGSCWAIAATNAIQLQANKLFNFTSMISAQDMVCSTPNPHNCGGTGKCQGATPELGFAWAAQNGMRSAQELRYTASADSTACPANLLEGIKPLLDIGGYHRLFWNNRGVEVQHSLVKAGPLAVGVSAGEWMNYREGVFTGCNPDPVVSHAVTLVGYGVGTPRDNGYPYWKLLNSWGESWGEHGFLRLRRYPEGEPCGWDKDPSKGVGCDGGPKKLLVCGSCGLFSDVSHPIQTKMAGVASS